ncbi:MAG: putative ATP-binding cassette sub-family E member 1 [Streblomastix strix]|uniref:Putative ATP-binding cassette sub-family E member 1 n=1 Tax=Streblomastix strix TaxID=222440 RepID=A0A5J4WC04_9EUKA|nr:MAG: putative ATP-binding cassette sub-family E member 1 [Streblomastix strix]
MSTYLVIKQRLKVARFILDLQIELNYFFVVDHDLSVVEYTSDIVNVVYGKGGVFGVVTLSMHVRDEVKNNIPAENLRFREYELSFKNTIQQSTSDEDGKEKPIQTVATTHHPEIHMTIGPFEIVCESVSFQQGEIIVLLGENGTEKTTFLNLITVAANGGVEVFRLKVNESGKDKLKQQENAALIEKERIEREKIEKEKESERIKRERVIERKGLQPILNLNTARQLLSQIVVDTI